MRHLYESPMPKPETTMPFYQPDAVRDAAGAVEALTRAQRFMATDESEISNYDAASAAEDLEQVANFAFRHQYDSDWKQVFLLLRQMAPGFWHDNQGTNKYLSQAVQVVDGEVGGVGSDRAKLAAAKETRLSVAESLQGVEILAEILLCLQSGK